MTDAPLRLPSVSVCFPAYNEETTIGGVLEEADALLAPSGLDYEILVCDDASTDRTGAIIEGLRARVGRMQVIRHSRNEGIRATFEQLYRLSSKEFVFLNSTDRQWPTRLLFDLLPLTRQWDIIVASRKRTHYGPGRALVSWSFNLVPPLVFGVRTWDAGAVKLVRREIITRFDLISRSPFSEAERIIRAARAGYRIGALPCETAPRQSGRGRGLNRGLLLASTQDVFRVWRALRTEARAADVSGKSPAESSHADRR